MFRTRLALVAALATAAALTVPASSLASAGRVAHPLTTTPNCKTSQLAIWLGNSNGTAGTIYYTLNFTNLGSACALRGYPGVSALSTGGAQLGASARRVTTSSPKTVTLKAAKLESFSSATANLGIVDIGALPTTTCKPTNAAALKVFPPNQTTAATVPLPFGACSKRGASFLTIAAIK